MGWIIEWLSIFFVVAMACVPCIIRTSHMLWARCYRQLSCVKKYARVIVGWWFCLGSYRFYLNPKFGIVVRRLVAYMFLLLHLLPKKKRLAYIQLIVFYTYSSSALTIWTESFKGYLLLFVNSRNIDRRHR